MQGVLPCSPGTVNADAHNTVDAQRHVGEPYCVCLIWEFDGAYNTVEKISTPTTLLGKVAWYCSAGVQGTILGIAVDLSALPYFLHPFPGPYRAGVPGRLVSVGSDCASWRRAVSKGSVHPRSKTRVKVGSGVLARPSCQRGHLEVG